MELQKRSWTTNELPGCLAIPISGETVVVVAGGVVVCADGQVGVGGHAVVGGHVGHVGVGGHVAGD